MSMTNHEVGVLLDHQSGLRDAALACTHKTKNPNWKDPKELALHTRTIVEMGRRYSIIVTADWADEQTNKGKPTGRKCWHWHFSICGDHIDASDLASFVGSYFMGKKPTVFTGQAPGPGGMKVYHGYVRIGKDLPMARTTILRN